MRDEFKKKRVARACDTCRVKKAKCDGSNPCARCRADNQVCTYTQRKRQLERVFTRGYVEHLEIKLNKVVSSFMLLVEEISKGHDCSKFVDGPDTSINTVIEKLQNHHSPIGTPESIESPLEVLEDVEEEVPVSPPERRRRRSGRQSQSKRRSGDPMQTANQAAQAAAEESDREEDLPHKPISKVETRASSESSSGKVQSWLDNEVGSGPMNTSSTDPDFMVSANTSPELFSNKVLPDSSYPALTISGPLPASIPRNDLPPRPDGTSLEPRAPSLVVDDFLNSNTSTPAWGVQSADASDGTAGDSPFRDNTNIPDPLQSLSSNNFLIEPQPLVIDPSKLEGKDEFMNTTPSRGPSISEFGTNLWPASPSTMQPGKEASMLPVGFESMNRNYAQVTMEDLEPMDMNSTGPNRREDNNSPMPLFVQ